MLTSPYEYQLELFTAGGRALGRAALAIDWEPAREWTRFSAIRAGRLAPNAVDADASVEPVWHPRAGRPYVNGFRVAMAIDGQQVGSDFSTEYVAPLAAAAVDALRKQASIETDAPVRYVTTAYPAEAREQPRAAGSFVSREIAADVVLRATPLVALAERAAPAGETSDEQMPAFIPRRVLDEAATLTAESGECETGGVLIGSLHRDPASGELFAEVTAQIAARHTEATSTSLAFTPATWTEVRAALTLRDRGELMLGWWHSHPVRQWCAACPPERQRVCSLGAGFLSTHDRALHRTVFPRAYTLALVVSDVAVDGPTFALFGWQQAMLARRGFNVIDGATVPVPPAMETKKC